MPGLRILYHPRPHHIFIHPAKAIFVIFIAAHEIEWNIETLGEIRDLIQLWFVERLAITDEMIFYPYIDTND